ncbi:MAG: hypothetical protein ABH817_01365 [archaeon]
MQSDFKKNLETLTQKHSTEIQVPYITAFTAHPWHEEFECLCGSGPYSLGCVDSMITQKNSIDTRAPTRFRCEEYNTGKLFPLNLDVSGRCRDCGEDLRKTLRPIFTPEGVSEDFLDAMNKKDFFGIGARVFDKLMGFLWGYQIPKDTIHVTSAGGIKFRENCELLQQKGIDLDRAFYHTEAVTLPEAQSLGIGTVLVEQMLRKMPSSYDFIVYRTINQAMTRCYERAIENIFGSKLKIPPAFKDSDPKKRQIWHLVDLTRVKR